MSYNADIGIFGGSGFYSFFKDFEEVKIDTPYGETSDLIHIGNIDGKKVAFIARHGANHQYPPHKVPYRANVYAMKQLGVKKILGPNASGSLQKHIEPGDFVICDQFVDRTWGRSDTFFDGPVTKHVSAAYPYCKELRNIAIEVGEKLGINIHKRGTVVVIQGPRFSTVAESKWFNKMGWDVINMTQYPECILAREMGICYVNISLITDYDVGLEGCDDIKPVTDEEVHRVFRENNDKVKGLIYEIIKKVPLTQDNCDCTTKF